MPLFFYKDPKGKETQIFPEAISRSLPNFYHCRLTPTPDDGKFVTVHRDCIKMIFTQEEILAQRKKQNELSSPSVHSASTTVKG